MNITNDQYIKLYDILNNMIALSKSIANDELIEQLLDILIDIHQNKV